MSIVKLNNRGVKNATAIGSITGLGSVTFLSKQTASNSATVSFTSGIDSTYKEYLITLKDIHPATNNVDFTINFRDGSSAFDATKTTSNFTAYHDEGDSGTGLGYEAGYDAAQSTSNAPLNSGGSLGGDADESLSGIIHLFDPSSTTFVKHFISNVQFNNADNYTMNTFVAGYCNTTAAIDGVQFAMTSGNIEVGDFCLYGIN